MKAKFFTAIEVAEMVGDKNNNPQLSAQLKLYLTTVEQQGFKFIREVKE